MIFGGAATQVLRNNLTHQERLTGRVVCVGANPTEVDNTSTECSSHVESLHGFPVTELDRRLNKLSLTALGSSGLGIFVA